ncbi:Phage antirepressor protein [Lachnospiraceae bacterium TWA4]|nr:Phage antirepressor protein [Lachnospiraceae bacterium TWA4]
MGKDIAKILKYSNTAKAIRDHVDEEDKTVNDSFTVNGTKGILINESGLYSLVLSSKLDFCISKLMIQPRNLNIG